MRKMRTLVDRFNEKWTLDPDSGCWLWDAYRMPSGYGTIRLGQKEEGSESAHRVSWIINRGPIPDRMCICHRCDNPPCVNPDHLFLGTYSENTLDAVSKDRFHPPVIRGTDTKLAKLTDDQVREIRKDCRASRAVGADYKVSHTVILYIRRGRTWSHIQ